MRIGVVALVLVVACGGGSADRVIMGVGTTLVDSGFIEAVAAGFEASHPQIQLSILGESSARVLSLGRSGSADVLITHAPAQEGVFLAEEHPQLSEVAFVSAFVLVGPPDLVGPLDGLSTAAALEKIVDLGYVFVSRGDGSGTNETELGLWEEAGIDPGGDWYVSTGQGMGLTLQVADQRHAFTLAESGSYASARDALDLRPVAITDPPLNPYRITVIEHPSTSSGLVFAEWLLSPQGRDTIARVNDELFGTQVFQTPND